MEEDELAKACDALPRLGEQRVVVDGRRDASDRRELARVGRRRKDGAAAIEAFRIGRTLLGAVGMIRAQRQHHALTEDISKDIGLDAAAFTLLRT